MIEKRLRSALLLLVVVAIVLLVGAIEGGLRLLYGLGSPVIYENNALYGYRPAPNQSTRRFGSARIVINNLSLRTDQHWQPGLVEDRVIFLGDSVTYGGSYIDNDELFSSVAVAGTDISAGNAGVNAWGVRNIKALVVDGGFLHARLYVTTLVEGDFYRGLQRIGGLPYWTRPPRLALVELIWFGLSRLNNIRYRAIGHAKSDVMSRRVVEIAASELAALDAFLTEKGANHCILITPTRDQLFDNVPRNEVVSDALVRHGLKVNYLADLVDVKGLKSEDIYVDTVHLTVTGHAIWGQAIHSLMFPATKGANYQKNSRRKFPIGSRCQFRKMLR